MICVIDNFDSFTYNLVHIIEKYGYDVNVYKSCDENLEEIKKVSKDIEAIVISPGPGHPSEAGISKAIVEEFYRTKPILGVCLGHQVLAEFFGAQVGPAERILHGRTSEVKHVENGMYRELPSSFQAMRYNSLLVKNGTLPECLEKTSWSLTADGVEEIMGFRHREFQIAGMQFHPESVLSEHGEKLVMRFFMESAT